MAVNQTITLEENPRLRRPDERNIVVTGFMGTGKSSIGRALAEMTGRPFVDMDSALETQFGKPIRQVFADEGEALFRVAEARLCQELSEQAGLVIATGGGALVNPHSRHALAQTGVLICLTASSDEIVRRLAGVTDRPLLAGDPLQQRQRVRQLLNERRHAYAAIPHQVDTTGRTVEEICADVLAAVAGDHEAPGMTRLVVRHPAGAYDLLIGEGLLARAGALLAARGVQTGPVVIVSNVAIFSAHGVALEEALRAAGYAPHVHLVEEGEQHKTLASVAAIYGTLAQAEVDRRGAIIALGGGVVGDMAGYAAATWLRGVPFVQCPTSLLSMVDASVGGKTGVDLPQGKNLVGAFKQPVAVILDTGVLETLPAAEFRSGLAEVVKHGIIGAPELFEQLEEHGPTSMKQLVVDAVRVKMRIVEADPFEAGQRALLNLGHTFGHALEQVSHYTIRHGEGVAIGITAAAHLAQRMDICAPSVAARIEALLERLGLPTRAPGYDPQMVRTAMNQDKKRAGKNLRFVLPRTIGEAIVVDAPDEQLVLDAIRYVTQARGEA